MVCLLPGKFDLTWPQILANRKPERHSTSQKNLMHHNVKTLRHNRRRFSITSSINFKFLRMWAIYADLFKRHFKSNDKVEIVSAIIFIASQICHWSMVFYCVSKKTHLDFSKNLHVRNPWVELPPRDLATLLEVNFFFDSVTVRQWGGFLAPGANFRFRGPCVGNKVWR